MWPLDTWKGVLEEVQPLWSLTWALTPAEGSGAGSGGQKLPLRWDSARRTKLRSASADLPGLSPRGGARKLPPCMIQRPWKAKGPHPAPHSDLSFTWRTLKG